MPVAVMLDFAGGTLDQYDQVIAKMGLSPGGATAPGGLFHWVAATDGGIRVVDVWDTKEQFEQFAAEQIGPFTQEVGMPNPPDVKFLEVHNYMSAA